LYSDISFSDLHVIPLGEGQGGTDFKPRYIGLYESGVLAERVKLLEDHLRCCTLCPRQCRVNRQDGRIGACGVGALPKVAAINIHTWEEPPISGSRGSGTIFFSGCPLECIFCQNYPISQFGVGRDMSEDELAMGMLELQRRGAHNINFVSPTHQIPFIAKALLLAVPMGIRIPIVYNTSGYERVDVLHLLEGIVDIYLPDIKYADPSAAGFCSKRPDYVDHNRLALLEMWRQTGPLRVNDKGIAQGGMMVRHLVLPDDLSGTRECLAFLKARLGPQVWVSLMHQYFPAHKAFDNPPLDRKVTDDEYEQAFRVLTDLDLNNGFVQETA
jgi:putative pyruvate formate lyase activating enzyme